MHRGDLVFSPFENGYIKYIVINSDGDDLIVKTYKSNVLDWKLKEDVLTLDEFDSVYNNELIYE